MSANDGVIVFTEILEQFRQQENNEHVTLDKLVESLLSSNAGQSYTEFLAMDEAPSDETEVLIFDTLVSRENLQNLIFWSTFDASDIVPLLSRLKRGTVRMVTLGGMQLSKSLANQIFETLLDQDLKLLGLFLREDYCPEVIHAFLHFLQSSVCSLALCCQPGDWISTEALQSICTGIIRSSVTFLKLVGLKVRGDNAEQVHQILAETILDSSSSIQIVQVKNAHPGRISLPLFSRALCQHPVIQNFDISFRAEDQDDVLIFDRNPWWKRLLAMDDLPLNLWPLLLEKADNWKRDASHSNLDVLYFLLREKNTELLQNVRRRRIRKRKRCGF